MNKKMEEEAMQILEKAFNSFMLISYKYKTDYDEAIKGSAEKVLETFKDTEFEPIAKYFVERKLDELKADYSTTERI